MSNVINYLKRAINKIKRDGAYNAIAQTCLGFESAWFDKKYNVDTHRIIPLSELIISNGNVVHGRQYQPILINHLRKILVALEPTKDDVLVDFGSGKGIVLLVSSMYQFKKVVGVEFSDQLCAIAKENVERFRGRKVCKIEINCVDAGEYQIRDDETIFYFFNPFDRVVMQKVIDNIKNSYHMNPRRIRVVYLNLKSQNLDSVSTEFKLVTDTELHGISFKLYETQSR